MKQKTKPTSRPRHSQTAFLCVLLGSAEESSFQRIYIYKEKTLDKNKKNAYNKHIKNFKCIILYYNRSIIMSEQVLIQFRADKTLKQEVADIYEQLGMDLPTAFRMFMARSKMVKGLPFEATLPPDTLTREDARNAFWDARKQLSNVPEMTIDEINAEIVAARNEEKSETLSH